MKGFKDSTRTQSGFHPWSGGSIGGGTGGTINRLARGGPVDKIDGLHEKNGIGGVREFKPYGEDHGLIRRTTPMTEELKEAGGTTPLRSGFKKGGPAKHFHVHKHFHAKGGKTHTVSHSYGVAEKHAESFADGGHVHDSTHVPPGGPDYAKGGKTGKKWIQGAIKHPGAFKAKAKRAGMSTAAYASKVTKEGSHASTQTKRQANLAKTLGKVRPVKKNAGGALYAAGGTTSKLAIGGVPMGGTPAVGALGRLAMRPQGLPVRPGLPMRRPMALPGPQPLMRAKGGTVGMRAVAKQEVAKHVRTAPPRGHGVR